MEKSAAAPRRVRRAQPPAAPGSRARHLESFHRRSNGGEEKWPPHLGIRRAGPEGHCRRDPLTSPTSIRSKITRGGQGRRKNRKKKQPELKYAGLILRWNEKLPTGLALEHTGSPRGDLSGPPCLRRTRGLSLSNSPPCLAPLLCCDVHQARGQREVEVDRKSAGHSFLVHSGLLRQER